MRGIFSLLGLVVVLAVIGMLVKKQLSPTPVALPTVPGASAPASGAAPATAAAQARQLQNDVRQSVEGALQAPRPMPEDAP